MAKETRYESTIIINGNLQEEQVEAIILKTEETVAKNGGVVVMTERWGRRKLAYMINKIESGFYVSVHFTSPGATVAKVERMYQLEDNIIRWLTLIMPEVNLDGRAAMKKRLAEVSARREREAKAAEMAEAEAANTRTVARRDAAAMEIADGAEGDMDLDA